MISMRKFSSRSNLYRSGWGFVILGVVSLVLWQSLFGQVSRPKSSKGPRALGLLQFLPGGKARLIPVVILVDGQYYDASAYKASPVPMALWSETVYEGLKTGLSQGLFTVTGALQNQKTNEWIAEGTWQTAESLAAKSSKKASPTIPRGLEDDSGPPTLRHSAASKPKPPDAASGQTAQSSAPTPTPTAQTPPPASPPQTSSTSAAAPEQKEEEDPNRPTLKRGKPAPARAEPEPSPTAPVAKTTAHAPSAASKVAPAQLIPAISDADSPEPHSYIYDVKPDEELTLRNKVVALAVDEVRLRAKQLTSQSAGSPEPVRSSKARTAARAKPEPPNFEDVQFRVFDLSNSNEPTMVLTATASLPEHTGQNDTAELHYFIAIVARQDINGDVHKAFSNVTDNQHLDVIPRFELIDAVDVDGDGRAELLFRKVYDASSAFVVYRVIGDQLYALFDGNPG